MEERDDTDVLDFFVAGPSPSASSSRNKISEFRLRVARGSVVPFVSTAFLVAGLGLAAICCTIVATIDSSESTLSFVSSVRWSSTKESAVTPSFFSLRVRLKHGTRCCWAPVIDKMIFYQQQLGAQTAGRANELSSQIILF